MVSSKQWLRTPLIIAGLIVVALTMPIQSSFSSTRTLDLTLYSDGSAHIFTQVDVDPLEPDFEVNLLVHLLTTLWQLVKMVFCYLVK